MSLSLADRLFVWMQYVLPHHTLSRLVGGLAASEKPWIKNPLIKWFSQRFGISLEEAKIQDPTAFPSFNAFFTRALQEGARPIDATEQGIVSPADGVVSQCGQIRGSDVLQAKGAYFSVYELLGGDAALAEEFINGHFATIYLRSEEHTSELQSRGHLVCRLLLEKKKISRNIVS